MTMICSKCEFSIIETNKKPYDYKIFCKLLQQGVSGITYKSFFTVQEADLHTYCPDNMCPFYSLSWLQGTIYDVFINSSVFTKKGSKIKVIIGGQTITAKDSNIQKLLYDYAVMKHMTIFSTVEVITNKGSIYGGQDTSYNLSIC